MNRYEEIRAQLRTGDVVLFSGKSFFSKLIRFGTGSAWSHVGLVLKLPEYNFLTIYESTGKGSLKDVVSGKPQRGVQLVPMNDRVYSYKGKIAVRQLEDIELDDWSIQSLMEVRKALRGRPYEKSVRNLLRAAWDTLSPRNVEDLSSVFCSELVAECYQSLGLLPQDFPSSEYTPGDFSALKGLKLMQGRLGHEIIIKE